MDSRFPTHYLNDRRVMRLSPSTFRTFVMATAWSVSNMTDGAIPAADLPLVPLATTEHATELINAGLWAEEDGSFQIVEFEKFQTSAAKLQSSLENRRESDRKRQAKKRERERDQSDEDTSRGQSRDGHVIFEGRGKAEAEAEALEEEGYSTFENSVDLETGEIVEGADTNRAPDDDHIAGPGKKGVHSTDTPADSHVSTATAEDQGRISNEGKINSLDDPRLTSVWELPEKLLELRPLMVDSVSQSAGERYRELTARPAEAAKPEPSNDILQALKKRRAA